MTYAIKHVNALAAPFQKKSRPLTGGARAPRALW